MRRYARLFLIYVKYQYKSTMTHKGAFIINCISQGLDYAMDFVLMWIMVTAFGSMGSWNQYEIMLLYALSLFSYAVAGTFFFKMTNDFERIIHEGLFDDALVKPIEILPYLVSTNIILNYIPHMTLSIIVTVFCFMNLPVTLDIFKILFYIMSIIFGSMIYATLFLLICIVTIRTTKSKSFQNIIFSLRDVSYYPLSILPKILQVILVFVVPYGLINFFPIQFILGKQDFLMFGSYMYIVSPVVAFFLFILAILGFRYTIRYYKSTGS